MAVAFKDIDGNSVHLPNWLVGGRLNSSQIEGANHLESAMSKPTSLTEMQDLSAALVGLVSSAAPTVVSLSSSHSRSSGFIWRSGLVVTADEALSEDGEYTVGLWNGDSVAAQSIGRDPSTDIALLRIDRSDLQPISLTAAALDVGALAIAAGAEDGTPTAALGVVSRSTGPWRSLRGGEINARIELDLRLRKSAEGGVVLNAAGQSVGMAVFGPRRRVLVIPSSTIERVAAQLEAHGYIPRGYLGLSLQPIALDGEEGLGAIALRVDPQGPGSQAGIYQGDILVSWNGEPIRHMPPLLQALGPDSVGQTVTIGIRRASQTQQVSVTIMERPRA
jgi:S1-C subfamily serine protease